MCIKKCNKLKLDLFILFVFYLNTCITCILWFTGDDAFSRGDPLSGHKPPQPLLACDQSDHSQPAAPRHGLRFPRCKEGRVSPP